MIRDNLYRYGELPGSTYLTTFNSDDFVKASDEEIIRLVEKSALVTIDGIMFNIKENRVVRAMIPEGSWTLAHYMNMCVNTLLNWEPQGDIKLDLDFGISSARRQLTKLIELNARFVAEDKQTVVYLTKENFVEWQLTN